MCGISGIVSLTEENYTNTVESMIQAISHRGPDKTTTVGLPGISLGHARLSIVDIGTGSQPMTSVSGDCVLVFNGEIYGYKSIRAGLPRYKFKTNSDTEVILALYETYGLDFFHRLPGMFSFALWDKKNRRLVAARDRFGEKPFYYHSTEEGSLSFASEIKAILTQKKIGVSLNEKALTHYLRHLYIPSTVSIYNEIQVLPPGHFLIWENGVVSTGPYWKPPTPQTRLTLSDASIEFRKLFETAVANQLVADVPVGAFLSGGLDSSSVVAVASEILRQQGQRLNTFSFKFEGSFDETHFASQIARKYSTDHTELVADGKNIRDLLLKMPSVYDEPFADSSNIPTYLISGLAREKMKVILTGDGADELMGGYSFWYKPLLSLNGKKGSKLEYYYSKAIAKLFLKTRWRNWTQDYRAKSERRYLYGSPLNAHIHKHGNFSSVELSALLGTYKNETSPLIDFDETLTINDALNLDLRNYMVGDILVKTDRASMAHGLELRAPFLDVPFAEFVLSLPSEYKIDHERDKIILREALGELWTDDIRNRPKAGFGAPVHEWLEIKEVRDLVIEYLTDPKKRVFDRLNFTAVQRFVEKRNYQTWILLCLAIWWETCPLSAS